MVVTDKLIQEWKTKTFEYEDVFQKESMSLISEYFPQFRNKAFHVPNEQYIPKFVNESPKDYEKRVKFYGAQNKGKGKLSGVPDIIIKYKGILYSLELKQVKGVVSEKQSQLHTDWALDFPEIQTQICKSLYDVYIYCKWIVGNRYYISRSER